MKRSLMAAGILFALGACSRQAVEETPPSPFIGEPLVTSIYTADPSAHVFDGRLYVYPSHDWEAGVPPDDLGSHFAMVDYHVLSMDMSDGATHLRSVKVVELHYNPDGSIVTTDAYLAD